MGSLFGSTFEVHIFKDEPLKDLHASKVVGG